MKPTADSGGDVVLIAAMNFPAFSAKVLPMEPRERFMGMSR